MASDNYSEWDKDKLINELKKLKSRKKYGIVWEEEKEAEQIVVDCKKKLPILKEQMSKKIIEKNTKKPINILIEGDNYHSLEVLNYTHNGKVDMIYIDPPYNTGNEDFKYNDNFVDKEDAYRHSKWLNFMSKRLRLAYNLLKSTGVMFVSINEQELCQLKLLCDEIFTEENNLAIFTIKLRHEDRILKGDKDFHEVVEYLLLYRKTKDFVTVKRIKDNSSNEEYMYEIEELIKKPKKIQMGSKIVEEYKMGQYKIHKLEPSEKRLKKISIRGSLKEGNSSGRFYMAHLDKLSKNKLGYLYKVPDMGGDSFGHRFFLTPTSEKRTNGDYFQGVPEMRSDTKEVPYPNYFDFEEDFNNVGYEGGVEFRNGKKPVQFLLKILEMGGAKRNKDSIILDFFAGSGSTGHAVLELNTSDEGNRKFILCTNNEADICSKTTYPRLKNAILGFSGNKRNTIAGLGGNLRYYKTDFIDVESVLNVSDTKKIELTYRAGELIALKEDVFEEKEKNEWWQIFSNEKKIVAIYFREDQKKLDELFDKLNRESNAVLYVFSWGKNDINGEEYGYDNVNVKDIPQPILDVYKELNRN